MAILLIFSGAATASGGDFSLCGGGGVFFGGLFTRYTLSANGQIDGNAVNVHADQEMNQINYGAFVFLDGTWVVLNAGIQSGYNTFKEGMIADSDRGTEMDTAVSGKGSESMLHINLLGKYPFVLNEQLTLFPLAGVEYQITLAQYREVGGRKKYNRTDGIRESDAVGNAYQLSAWNSLLINIGAGMDIGLSSSLFLRAELLYGFRLQTPYEIDMLEKTKKGVNAPNPKLSGLTSGPALKVAAGWRFL